MSTENENINSIIQRRHWFQKHLNQFVVSPRKYNRLKKKLYTCPCCAFPTLHVRNLYDVCTVFFWEDNGQDDPEVDEVWGGPNGDYSLTDARRNFTNYQSMFSPKDEYDFSIHSGVSAQKAKQKLMDYYNEIRENLNRYSQQEIFDQLENYFENISQIISRTRSEYLKS